MNTKNVCLKVALLFFTFTLLTLGQKVDGWETAKPVTSSMQRATGESTSAPLAPVEVLQLRLENLKREIDRQVRVPVADALAEINKRKALVGLRMQRIALEERIKNLQKEQKKAQPKEEKKAVAEQRSFEKKVARQQKWDDRTLYNAAISGCPVDTVVVAGWATGRYSPRRYVKVRVVNDSGLFINEIVDTHKNRVAVKNLCSTGSISLFETTEIFDDTAFTYKYVASTVVDGKVLYAESQSFSLSSQSTFYSQEDYVWKIKFPEYHPPQK